MTEQEYMDATDLSRLRIVQYLLSECYTFEVDVTMKKMDKLIKKMEIKVSESEE